MSVAGNGSDGMSEKSRKREKGLKTIKQSTLDS